MSVAKKSELIEEIQKWKTMRNAIILAHNYELPEIQDIADVLGDSLTLARPEWPQKQKSSSFAASILWRKRPPC